jgi:hypothetical protein
MALRPSGAQAALARYRTLLPPGTAPLQVKRVAQDMFMLSDAAMQMPSFRTTDG